MTQEGGGGGGGGGLRSKRFRGVGEQEFLCSPTPRKRLLSRLMVGGGGGGGGYS